MGSLIVGIISGILTTILILSAKSFFYKVLVPWYLKVRYKGVDLSGKWMATTEDYTFTIEIRQSANDLNGILVISNKDVNNVPTTSHYLKGEVWEGYLSLSVSTVDRKYLAYGNMLLKIESGNLLEGLYTARRFQDSKSIGIVPNKLEFKRCTP